jgi:hypothetical protein
MKSSPRRGATRRITLSLVVVVLNVREFVGYIFDVLSMFRRYLGVLCRRQLTVDNHILLWPPLLRWLRFDVLNPALDRLNAPLTVLLVFRIESVRRV